MTSRMSSRNRLTVVLAALAVGLAAVLAYALGGAGTGSAPVSAPASTASAPTAPFPTASAPSTAAPSVPSPRTPAPSAPGPGTPGPSAPRSSPAGSAAAGWVPTDPALADVCRSRLPAQAGDTLGLIARGGPYPYRSDGVVFENRENRLPRRASGYYHEYTVVTPGSTDRGTRRIVTGGAGEQYWTADHYATFQEIDPRC